MAHPGSRAVSALIACNVLLLSVICLGAIYGFTSKSSGVFKDISAERITVVGTNGKPVIVMAGKGNLPGPSMNGKTYPAAVSEGRDFLSGMIFFNEEGDEVGGLIFESATIGGRKTAVGHLSFDQYKQNQTVALQNIQNARGVRAGLNVYDRPTDVSMQEQLDLLQELLTAPAEKNAEIKAKLSALHDRGEDGVQRVFIGSDNRVAMVQLRDSKGRIRARLKVDAGDDARLEFLDDKGQVTSAYPPK